MSDIFTIKSVEFSPQIGNIFKQFRLSHNVKAKAVYDKFGKKPSYITKLEKGEIKRVKSDEFIRMCNFISGDEKGLSHFRDKLQQERGLLTSDRLSRIYAMNIDTLLYEYFIPKPLIDELKRLMDSTISVSDVYATINQNNPIKNEPTYAEMPLNLWIASKESNTSCIKFNVPEDYIAKFFDYQISTGHFAIILGITRTVFSLCGNSPLEANDKAYKLLETNGLTDITYIKVSSNSGEKYMYYPQHTGTVIDEISKSLSVLSLYIDSEKLVSKYENINNNLHADVGFSVSYMGMNLDKLIQQPRDVKKEFFTELRQLIEKYSQELPSTDFYD